MAITNAYQHVFDDVTEFPRNITIDLAARYAAAFGMQAAGSLIDKVFVNKTPSSTYELQYYPQLPNDFENVKFEIEGSDLAPLAFGTVLTGATGAVFAAPLLMRFSQRKALVETKVNDDDPVVVERWGTEPWEIVMNGLLIDLENRIYPSDEIRKLNQTWRQNEVVKVVGQQFEELDIDSIYFTSISFNRTEGIQDQVKFSIRARSIKAVNFTLLKPNS